MPVYAQLAADFETPLSAYVKISGHGEAFLFESAESSGESGRYSILGNNPRAVIKAEGLEITHWQKGEHDSKRTWTAEKDVLSELEQIMGQYKPAPHGDAPPFYGGAVGYLSYDAVRQFEPSIGPATNDDLGFPTPSSSSLTPC